jgi:hypothetical protein
MFMCATMRNRCKDPWVSRDDIETIAIGSGIGQKTTSRQRPRGRRARRGHTQMPANAPIGKDVTAAFCLWHRNRPGAPPASPSGRERYAAEFDRARA